MKSKFLGFFALIISLFSLSFLSSCGEATVDNSRLVIGMECGYQPFNWTVSSASEYTLPIDGTNEFADGYDIQIAKYLSEDLGKEVVIKRTVWDSLITDLNAGNINMVLAGMSSTAERREQIDFTDPYLTSDLAFLIQKENIPEGNSETNPLSYEDLLTLFSGESLICQRGVVGDDLIETYFSSVDETIQHNDPANTYPLAAMDVDQGVSFAMPAELPVCEAMVNISPDNLGILYVDQSFISDVDKEGLSVSIGIKKGNDELREEINASLAKLSDEKRGQMMGEAAQRSATTDDSGETTTSSQNIWTLFTENFALIGAGIVDTIILAVFGTGVGLILGIFIAYGKNWKAKESDKEWLKRIKRGVVGLANLYSTILRGTPMMVQALIFKYGCQAIGLNWGNIYFQGEIANYFNGWFIAGLIVITLNTAAYMGEIVRSGLNGVDIGQVEGARSLGMSSTRTSITIILPQALKNALPTIGNELIVNIKDSSVLNVIAVTELYYRMMNIASTTFAFLEAYIILALVYLVLTLIASAILKLIEKKLDGVKFSLNPFRWARKKEVF